MVIHSAPELDSVFHALSDPTRRGMLGLLARSEHTASELGDPFAMSQPAWSKHIAVLERAGLVKRSIAGRVHRLPDGSDRYLVDQVMLLEKTRELGGELLDPLKTSVVQDLRCMTTWVARKRTPG